MSKTMLALAMALMFLGVFPQAARGDDICTLVRDGKGEAVIVLAPKPTRPAQLAAAELAHYIKKITGAELPVITEDKLTEAQAGGNLVLVGESERTRKLSLTSAGLKRQEHIVKNSGKWLVIMGRDEQIFGPVNYESRFPWPECRLDFPHRVYFKALGSFYAVSTFLERELGLRWYMPGELGEVVPKTKTIITRGLNLKLKPWSKTRISTRLGSWDYFDFYIPGRTPKKRIPPRDMLLWWLRLKMGGDPWQVNHSVYSYYDRFAKEHPDWFANSDPKPRKHPCYTHPGFIEQHAQDARDYFDGKFPKMVFPKGGRVLAAGDYYPACPIDSSSGWCECSRCKPLLDIHQPVPKEIQGAAFFNGYYSQYVWTFVNAVAKEVRKTHPDKKVSAIAYARYFLPPKNMKLEPNLSICITRPIMAYPDAKAKKYFNDTITYYYKQTGELMIWEYYLNQYFNAYMAFPWITPHLIAEDIEFLKTVGVVGKFVEMDGWKGQWTNPAEQYLPTYITYKLLADDSHSVDEVLDEHYRLFYGPAEKPMKAFFEQFEKDWLKPEAYAKGVRGQRRHWEVVCPPKHLTVYNDIIKKAIAAAGSQEPYATRVRLMYEAIYKPTEKHSLLYAARTKKRKRMACPKLKNTPVIDGLINEEAWENAAKTTPFVTTTMEKVKVDTIAYVGRDNKNLYIAFRCLEPNMDKIKAVQNRADDLTICLDDDVEIFIDVGRTRSNYYHLMINSNGILADRSVGFGLPQGGVGWNSGAVVRAIRGVAEWTVEVAIPLKSMGAKPELGQVWGFNACRGRRAGVKSHRGENTCWSPTFGGFNSPDEFGAFEMTGPEGFGPKGASKPVVEINFEDAIKKDRQTISTGKGIRVAGRDVAASATLRRTGKDSTPWDAALRVKGKSGFGYAFKADAKRYIAVKFPKEFGLAADDFTIMMWCKTENTENQTLYSSTTTAPLHIFAFAKIKNTNFLRFLFATKPPTRAAAAKDPPIDGKWHHVAVSVDRGKRATIYIDGEKSGDLDISSQKGDLKTLVNIGGPYKGFDGVIDSFRIYKGAMDPEEIKKTYEAQASGK